jgi:hypothetical protein
MPPINNVRKTTICRSLHVDATLFPQTELLDSLRFSESMPTMLARPFLIRFSTVIVAFGIALAARPDPAIARDLNYGMSAGGTINLEQDNKAGVAIAASVSLPTEKTKAA